MVRHLERLEDELEHLDPTTGASVGEDAIRAARATSSTAGHLRRWMAGVVLAALTAGGAFVVTQHRAAERVIEVWGTAREGRRHLFFVLTELYQVEQIARVSTGDDFAGVVSSRRETAELARSRLARAEADLRAIWILDATTDRTRDRAVDRVHAWIVELDEFTDGNRIFLDGEPPTDVDADVAQLRDRWRTGPVVHPDPGPLPASRTIEALRRPVDDAIPGVVLTAIDNLGQRVDADLATRTITVTKLTNLPPSSVGPPGRLRRLHEGLLLEGIGSTAAALPSKPGADVDFLGSFFTVPSAGARTWVQDNMRPAAARPLDASVPPFPVPDPWSVVAANDDGLFLARFGEDGVTKLDVVDPETGRRSTLAPTGGDVVGVGPRTVVWTTGGSTTLHVSSGGATRTIDLLPGTYPSQRMEVADDGTIALALSEYDSGSTTTQIALLRPGSTSLDIVHVGMGSEATLSWSGEWLFWSIGTYNAPTGIVAYNATTGERQPVRLPLPARTFVAHAG